MANEPFSPQLYMSDPLRLLIVEDSKEDTWLIVRELQRGGFRADFERVETASDMRDALEKRPWDLIISDYSMPLFAGPAALALYKEMKLDIPFISVSGLMGEETAVEMMRAGAHDYVMKDNLARLGPAVVRELGAAQERRVRRQTEAAMAHMAAIVESCEDAIIGKNLDGTIISWNKGAERLYGYSTAEMVGKPASILTPDQRSLDLHETLEMLKRGEPVGPLETIRVRKNGHAVQVLLTISPIRDGQGRVIGASSIARDISERKRQENEKVKLIEELTDALARVKTLSGLLPICASCKRIRDDKGYWQQVEAYIKDRSDAEFTHGICPECAARLYPEYPLRASPEQKGPRDSSHQV
jgi:PAS domain S-box-containing protein